MNRSLLFFAMALLAAGCEQPPVPVSASGDAPAADARLNLPVVPPEPDGIRLATLSNAWPVEPRRREMFVMNVNARGQVALPSGRRVTLLELKEVLAARYESDRKWHAELQKKSGLDGPVVGHLFPLEIALRIDRDTPFARVYPVWRAVEEVELVHCEVRVQMPDGKEGYFGTVISSREGYEEVEKLVVRLAGGPNGKLTAVTIDARVKLTPPSESGLDVDVDAALPEPGKPLPPVPKGGTKPEDAPQDGGRFKRDLDLKNPAEELRRHLQPERNTGKILVFEVDGRLLFSELAPLLQQIPVGFRAPVLNLSGAKSP